MTVLTTTTTTTTTITTTTTTTTITTTATTTTGCIAQLAERRSLAGELTLSCARPSEDG